MDGAPIPQALMPPPAPIEMPVQDFRAHPKSQAIAPRASARTVMWRAIIFGSTGAAIALLLGLIGHWLAMGGLMWMEILLLALIGVTAIWILLTVASALAGLHALIFPPRDQRVLDSPAPLRTALLTPIYNESPRDVVANAAAMLTDLFATGSKGAFDLFILSDTQDEITAAKEVAAIHWLRAQIPDQFAVYYRRRVPNTDRKVGNIADWVTGWGNAYDAMLVLDADSLMSGAAIAALAEELAADPNAGLIQSFPRLIGSTTIFGRLQQFSNAAYGFLLAEGLSRWSGREGNFWGHNAIIRTRAFAQSAGLPHVKARAGKTQMIWSHDFVEAALLRRAGWGVRFMPRIDGSYEETPPSLIDHVLRDRRWCQGNLQHLRLLGVRGLHPVSRFHMFHGAMAYLLSPAWFLLLVIWALLGPGQEASVISYFSDTNPLYPIWPEMERAQSILFLAVMYGMLLAPKLLAIAVILTSPSRLKGFGGLRCFIPTAIVELLGSIAYAPLMMVQQTTAILRIAFGLRVGWSPQNRASAQRLPWSTLARFHALETLVGALLVVGMSVGAVSLWLLPIAASLLVAIPLSAVSGNHVRRNTILPAPEHLNPPQIWTLAQEFKEEFDRPQAPLQVAAE